MAEYLQIAWKRQRPEEGWLPVFLSLAIVATLVAAVVGAGWTPEVSVVMWTAPLGMLLGVALAKRPVRPLLAWSLIIAYGLAIPTILLGRLGPPLRILFSGWGAFSEHVRLSLVLLYDRTAGWFEAVTSGGRSQETIIFSFGLAVLAWVLSAYVGWSTFRHHRPLTGLIVLALALAINGFYGDAPLWPVGLFNGLAALLAATIHFADLERIWTERQADYSDEIRLELLVITGGAALILWALTTAIPAINVRQLYRALLDRPAVHEAEDALDRIFSGVRSPRRGPSTEEVAGQASVQAGMPRSYLLGNAPELYETVVMTASVEGTIPPVTHWRALSYDIYTGRGWSISEEQQETLEAGRAAPVPLFREETVLVQEVHWLPGQSRNRYSLGQPVTFDQDVTLFWRGRDDMSRVQGSGNDYRVNSRASVASPSELRRALLADIPQNILARYTRLPASIPDRVHELAEQIAGDQTITPTPYDQARALEQFLRQYPYSLEVRLPPTGADPVDFFLFELQAGYCDYYASSMVILARSLGLPARLAAGFLAQDPDENGVQILRQINGHSWAEIYFAGYGWVEFEPTAPFLTRSGAPAGGLVDETGLGELADVEPPPLPETARQTPPLVFALLLLPLIALAWWWFRDRRRSQLDRVHWAYSRLQKSARLLGEPGHPSQTPLEFEIVFIERLNWFNEQKLAGRLQPAELVTEAKQVIKDYVARQYGRRKPAGERAMASWRRIRFRLWLLGLIQRLPRAP